MKPAPADWPRFSSALFYADPLVAIDWLVRAFGFEIKIKVIAEDGTLRHSELTFGGGIVMVAGEASATPWHRSPRSIGGGNTQTLMVHVEDVDALCTRARAAGATIVSQPKDTDYGAAYWADRSAELIDPEGHHWWFVQRLRDPPA